MMTIANLIFISAIVALCFILTGCKRALPPGAVLFAGSGIAITPGNDWQPMRSNVLTAGQKAICPPVLEGKGVFRLALIEVFTTEERANAQAGVAAMQKEAATILGATPDSFKMEEFTTVGGLQGFHTSYEHTFNAAPGLVVSTRTHSYLFQNKKGQCICIKYITPTDKDSDLVHEMILKTLILQ
jgi:hypothetical protein